MTATRHPSLTPDAPLDLHAHWSAVNEATGDEVARGVTESHLAEVLAAMPDVTGPVYTLPTRLAAREGYSMIARVVS